MTQVEREILQLVDLLQHGEVLHAPALPFKRKGFYADMILITKQGDLQIVGEGFDLEDGEEVFFLNLAEYKADTYWHDKDGIPAWPPQPNQEQKWAAVDLVLDIKKSELEAVLASNRRVRFYRSPLLSGVGPRGVLQSAAAVSFAGCTSNDRQLLIYATPEFPCSLEVVMEASHIQSILAGLEEFHLK